MKLQKLTKWGFTLIGILGFIVGAIACYIQPEEAVTTVIKPLEENSNAQGSETRSHSSYEE